MWLACPAFRLADDAMMRCLSIALPVCIPGTPIPAIASYLQAAFDAAVAVLEADGGVAAPTDSPQLDGRWRLLFTTRPGTASPIQRTFTAVDSFKSEISSTRSRGAGCSMRVPGGSR